MVPSPTHVYGVSTRANVVPRVVEVEIVKAALDELDAHRIIHKAAAPELVEVSCYTRAEPTEPAKSPRRVAGNVVAELICAHRSPLQSENRVFLVRFEAKGANTLMVL